jgi:methenyltetrahydrofolate cyclohydrolase
MNTNPVPDYSHDTLHHFTEQLSTSQPVPAGGSTAALAGALGISLGIKIRRILDKHNPALHADRISDLEMKRDRLLQGVQADAEGYTHIMHILADQTKSNSERTSGIMASIKESLEQAKICLEVLEYFSEVFDGVNLMLKPDLSAAMQLLYSTLMIATENVQSNAALLSEPSLNHAQIDQITTIRNHATPIRKQIDTYFHPTIKPND